MVMPGPSLAQQLKENLQRQENEAAAQKAKEKAFTAWASARGQAKGLRATFDRKEGKDFDEAYKEFVENCRDLAGYDSFLSGAMQLWAQNRMLFKLLRHCHPISGVFSDLRDSKLGDKIAQINHEAWELVLKKVRTPPSDVALPKLLHRIQFTDAHRLDNASLSGGIARNDGKPFTDEQKATLDRVLTEQVNQFLLGKGYTADAGNPGGYRKPDGTPLTNVEFQRFIDDPGNNFDTDLSADMGIEVRSRL